MGGFAVRKLVCCLESANKLGEFLGKYIRAHDSCVHVEAVDREDCFVTARHDLYQCPVGGCAIPLDVLACMT